MSVSNGRMSRRQFVRRTFAVATSAGFVSALSACAPASPPAAVPAAQATEKPPEAAPTVAPAAGGEATRIVWYNNGDPVRNAWEEDVVKKYAEIAPDTKVELMIVPWDEFEPKMAALLASGQPPDVWSEWGSSGFMDYYHRDMLFDQTEFAKRDAAELELEAYEPKLIEMFKVSSQ